MYIVLKHSGHPKIIGWLEKMLYNKHMVWPGHKNIFLSCLLVCKGTGHTMGFL